MELFGVSNFLHTAFKVFTQKQNAITVHTQAKWIPQITVTCINVTEELSLCVKDVNTMVTEIRGQDATLTICCDTIGCKWIGLGR